MLALRCATHSPFSKDRRRVQPLRPRPHLLALGWLVTLGTLLTAHPMAAHAQRANSLDRSGQYASEVRACKEGRTAEDQATCLREARNAQADRKRGQLDRGGNFQANALARCNVLQGDDRRACEMRMRGEGRVTGSVEGGGVLREVEVVISPPTRSMGSGPARPAERPDPGAAPSRPTERGAADTAPQGDDDDDEEVDTPASGSPGSSGSGS